MRKTLIPAALVALSLPGFLFLGVLVDIGLTYMWSLVSSNQSGPVDTWTLPSGSLWVYEHLAGSRDLPQIMVGLWVVLALFFVVCCLFGGDGPRFHYRFLYGFVSMWTLVLVFVIFVAWAAAAPADLMFTRISDGHQLWSTILLVFTFLTGATTVLLPIIVVLRRRSAAARAG